MTISNFHFLLLFLSNLTSNWVIFDEKWNVKLKNFVYPFCAHFCKSHVQTWHLWFFQVYMIECWSNVDEQRKMHLVTHIFITDNKKPSFLRIGQHLGTPDVFLKSIPFPTDASLSWLDTYILLVISWKLTFKCRSKEFVWIVNCNGK